MIPLRTIPRHAPPFSLGGLLSAACQRGYGTPAELERFCAERLCVKEAVVLPSARAGILLALRAVATSVKTVVGPAFSCGVVHQAMQLSGLSMRFVDCDPSSYLMNVENLNAACDGRSAIVLCETYGFRYHPCVGTASSGRLDSPNLPPPRIWDMAMCIPQAADFQRLTANDCAVVSFGLGKCLYAGWGGLLLTQNSEQASRVRELSRRMVAEDSLSNRCRHAFEVLARTTAHLRILYGLGRKLADWRNRPSTRSPVVQQPAPEEMPQQPMIDPDRSRGQGRSREWREPMTTLNRKLARRNLIVAEEAIDLRRRQAEIYRRILEPSKTLFVAGSESLPQSHFPIGIASGMRSEFRRLLASEGIDTGTYFPFPRSLQRSIYPNASRAADEVVLLPLGPCVSQREVEVIAKRALKISGQILKQGVP